MKLENEIKQRAFQTEAEKAIVNISYTHSYIAGLLNSALKVHNISIQQFNVLRILKGSDPRPVSVNDITDRMIDKMSNASRLVEKLRAKGLVSREKCPFDRRQVDVSITEEGQALLVKLNEETQAVITGHMHITEEEFRQLNDILDRLRKS